MTPDVLSQNEIDSLLEALSSGSVDVDAMRKEDKKAVKLYDFRRPDKFSKDQLRAIQMIHESFTRRLTSCPWSVHVSAVLRWISWPTIIYPFPGQ